MSVVKYIRRWWHLVTHRGHCAVTVYERDTWNVVRVACDCGRIFVILLLLALPTHAERRLSVVVPQTQIHVGQSARIPVSIPNAILIQTESVQFSVLYPEILRVTAVDQVMPYCAGPMSIAPNVVSVAVICQGPRWLGGPLVWLTVQALAPGKAMLSVTDCEFAQIKGTDATGYPNTWRLDCDGPGGQVEVVP